jgi:hypothetical protein
MTTLNNLSIKLSKKMSSTTVIDYSNRNLDLSKLKQKDLKEISKLYQLRVSGNKSVLLNRIQAFFDQDVKVVLLQKIVRGFFVRHFFKLRGSYNKTIKESFVNDTDFYTMDPINEIAFYNLFSYTDDKEFNYCFNIQSLVSLYFKTGKITNPYNRNKFPLQTVLNIFSLYGMIKIIFGEQIETTATDRIPPFAFFKRQNDRLHYYTEPPDTTIIANNNTIIDFTNTVIARNNTNTVIARNNTNNVINFTVTTNAVRIGAPARSHIIEENSILLNERRTQLLNMRTRPINTRIEELFIEIDLLGNYTISSWFSTLSTVEIYTFYTNLRDVWYWKAGIYNDTRRRLYPFGDLFEGDCDLRDISRYRIEEVFAVCTTIMENLVFSALDREDRILATNFVLMALTSVSINARRQFYWLYESIRW